MADRRLFYVPPLPQEKKEVLNHRGLLEFYEANQLVFKHLVVFFYGRFLKRNPDMPEVSDLESRTMLFESFLSEVSLALIVRGGGPAKGNQLPAALQDILRVSTPVASAPSVQGKDARVILRDFAHFFVREVFHQGYDRESVNNHRVEEARKYLQDVNMRKILLVSH